MIGFEMKCFLARFVCGRRITLHQLVFLCSIDRMLVDDANVREYYGGRVQQLQILLHWTKKGREVPIIRRHVMGCTQTTVLLRLAG
jgi:hypothetical protein